MGCECWAWERLSGSAGNYFRVLAHFSLPWSLISILVLNIYASNMLLYQRKFINFRILQLHGNYCFPWLLFSCLGRSKRWGSWEKACRRNLCSVPPSHWAKLPFSVTSLFQPQSHLYNSGKDNGNSLCIHARLLSCTGCWGGLPWEDVALLCLASQVN